MQSDLLFWEPEFWIAERSFKWMVREAVPLVSPHAPAHVREMLSDKRVFQSTMLKKRLCLLWSGRDGLGRGLNATFSTWVNTTLVETPSSLSLNWISGNSARESSAETSSKSSTCVKAGRHRMRSLNTNTMLARTSGRRWGSSPA